MKTILILLLAFTSYAQDSIPCDMTRQQSRLYFGVLSDRVKLAETQLKLEDAQHKRENTKELKFLRFEYKTFKVRNKYLVDSLDNAHDLLMRKEKDRSKEALKTSQNETKRYKMDSNNKSKELQILKQEAKKKANGNLIWVIVGSCTILGLIIWLVIVIKSKK